MNIMELNQKEILTVSGGTEFFTIFLANAAGVLAVFGTTIFVLIKKNRYNLDFRYSYSSGLGLLLGESRTPIVYHWNEKQGLGWTAAKIALMVAEGCVLGTLVGKSITSVSSAIKYLIS